MIMKLLLSFFLFIFRLYAPVSRNMRRILLKGLGRHTSHKRTRSYAHASATIDDRRWLTESSTKDNDYSR